LNSLLGVEVLNKGFLGQKFNRLTVIRPTSTIKSIGRLYECLCDCGNTCYYSKHSIETGSVKSCKCLRLEMTREMGRARKGTTHPKTLKRRISQSKVNRWGKTVNGRAYDSLLSVRDLIQQKFGDDLFCYVWRLCCTAEAYDSAQHYLEKVYQRKNNKWLGNHRVTCLIVTTPETLELIVMSAYKSVPGGRYYTSLKRVNQEWIFGRVSRSRVSGIDALDVYLKSIAHSLDQSLDFRPNRKIKTLRVALT
jgi:hypothetical protein